MTFATGFAGREQAITDLFTATFTAAEGEAEGRVVGRLARDLLAGTAPGDIDVFTADAAGTLIGAVIFTRLRHAGDARRVVLLSPMAVATDRQGQGVGQALLGHALAALRQAGVDVAMTYGDPAFYGKVGFMPVSATIAPPPLPLSRPEGWIGQSLTGAPLTPLQGPCTCVAALNDPAVW